MKKPPPSRVRYCRHASARRDRVRRGGFPRLRRGEDHAGGRGGRGGREIAIVDVTVIPMEDRDRDRELPHETVVVRGDRIVAMGPVGETKVSANARRIDGAGRYLIPGLIDMHVHLDRASLPLYVANGVTSVRNMSGRPRDLIWRDRIAKGELFGPTIFTTGPMVDGSPPSWNGSVSLVSPSDAEAEVAREQRVGYDFVKILQTLPRETYDAVVQAAHRHGMRVFGHVPTPVPLEHALAERQDSNRAPDRIHRRGPGRRFPVRAPWCAARRALAHAPRRLR